MSGSVGGCLISLPGHIAVPPRAGSRPSLKATAVAFARASSGTGTPRRLSNTSRASTASTFVMRPMVVKSLVMVPSQTRRSLPDSTPRPSPSSLKPSEARHTTPELVPPSFRLHHPSHWLTELIFIVLATMKKEMPVSKIGDRTQRILSSQLASAQLLSAAGS